MQEVRAHVDTATALLASVVCGPLPWLQLQQGVAYFEETVAAVEQHWTAVKHHPKYSTSFTLEGAGERQTRTFATLNVLTDVVGAHTGVLISYYWGVNSLLDKFSRELRPLDVVADVLLKALALFIKLTAEACVVSLLLSRLVRY